MLPSSTTNDSPDAQRRRSARRSHSINVPSGLLAFDSPAEKVAARKRRLMQSHPQHNDHHQILDNQNMGIPQSTSEGGARLVAKPRKKLSPTDSARSLDSAADHLERERVEQIHGRKKEQQSRSHSSQRQSLPSSEHSDRRGQRSARSSLSDFKSMLRNIIPSKKQSQEQKDQGRRRATSERTSRTASVQSQRQSGVQSEHKARTTSRPSSETASRTRTISLHSDSGPRAKATTQRPLQPESGSRATSYQPVQSERKTGEGRTTTIGHHSVQPQKQPKVQSGGRSRTVALDVVESQQRPTGVQSERQDRSASKLPAQPLTQTQVQSEHRRRTEERQARRGSDTDVFVGSEQLSEQGAHRRRSNPSLAAAAAATIGNPGLTRPPWWKSEAETSTASMKRKAKRDELVEELTLKESLRVRDRPRDPTTQGQWSTDLAAPPVPELSTKDDSIVSGHGTTSSDHTASKRRASADPSISSTVAAVLSFSTRASSTQSDSSTVAKRLNITHDHHRGHSSPSPVSSEQATSDKVAPSSKSGESLSVPPTIDKESDRSKGDLKADASQSASSSEQQLASKIRLSTSKARMDIDDRPSASSRRASIASIEVSSSKSKSQRSGSVPPSERRKSHRRHSSSQDLSRSSSRSDSKTRKRTKSKEKKSPSASKSKKLHESAPNLLGTSASDLEGSRSASDTSARRSVSKKKTKSKREDVDESLSSKSRRETFPATSIATSVKAADTKSSKKPPKTPKKKEFLGNASERSLTVDDISNLDESATNLLDESKTAESAEAKSKKKKKTKKESSSKSLKTKSKSKSESRSWRSDPSGMQLSGSFDDTASDSRRKDTARKPVRRSKTADKLTKKSSSKTKETESSQALGKSPYKWTKLKSSKRATSEEPRKAAAESNDGVGNPQVSAAGANEARKQADDSEVASQVVKKEEKRPHKSPKRHRKKSSKDGASVAKAAAGKAEESFKDKKQVSIGKYLSKGEKAIEKKLKAEHVADSDAVSEDSRMPSLCDILSVELSMDGSKECDSPLSTKSDQMKNRPQRERFKGGDLTTGEESPEQDAELSELVASSRGAEIDPNDLATPSLRDSLVDVFRDSPSFSPLASSMPLIFEPRDPVYERLTSSLPNLDYHNQPRTAEATREASKEPSPQKSVASEGIFHDDSDDSPGSQVAANLEAMSDNREVDVMSEIAGQIEERHENKPLQPRRRSESFRASLISEFRLASPMKDASTSPRAVEATSDTVKQDLGPRKPQRRRDSFEDADGKSPPPLERLTPNVQRIEASVESEDETDTTSRSQEDDVIPVAFGSTNMEFHRSDDKGWIQKPAESDAEEALLSGSAKELHSYFQSAMTIEENAPSETNPSSERVRRASMSDIEGAGAIAAAVERWNSSAGKKSDAPPSFSRSRQSSPTNEEAVADESADPKSDAPPSSSRQSYSPSNEKATNDMTSAISDNDELTRLFSLPKGAGTKDLGRSYLPASLQNASSRPDRAVKQPSAKRPGTGRSKEKAGAQSREKAIAAETGLSDMFATIGELEEDIVEFDSQVASLHAQQVRVLEDSEEEAGEAAKEPEGDLESAGNNS